MTMVKVQKRDMNVKAKKLRREGFVPGIVCGKEIKEKLAIQMEKKEAMKLIKEKQKGERVELDIQGEKINAIIKGYTFNALTKQIEVLDFQALVKGEKIHTAVEVILKNESMVDGVVTQETSEIQYKADSDHFVAPIVIDFEKIRDVATMKVSDLDICKDPNIFVYNKDSIIYSISKVAEVEEDEEEETVAE